MKFCNGWIEIYDPIETAFSEENICEFCKADQEECGEWNVCCYIQVMREIEMRYK